MTWTHFRPVGATQAETRAIETAVLGPEHADEHVAVLRPGGKWAPARPPASQAEPGKALSSEGAAGRPGLALGGRRVDPGAVPAPHLCHQHRRAADGQGVVLGPAPLPGGGESAPNMGEAALWSPWLGTGPSAFPMSPRR